MTRRSPARFSAAKTARNLSLVAATAALVLGAAAPAYAGGGHRGHGHGHHHHHRGGGKGAAIALGVIGGAIILNELAESRARDRYYDDRYYDDRYRRSAYDDRAYDDRVYYEDERAYRGDDYDDYYDDDYGDAYDDSELAGGRDYAPAPVRVSSDAAYRNCLDHARRALGERGFVITAPYRPDTVEDRGQALLMTATVRAQRGGDSWARAMSCEASENRVYRMELI